MRISDWSSDVCSSDLYHDLTADLYNKLNDLSYGPMERRQLTEDEATVRTINDLPLALNKYIILNDRHKQFGYTCECCHTPIINNRMICGGCYRIVYDSQNCQTEHWAIHKKDCLHDKEQINKIK